MKFVNNDGKVPYIMVAGVDHVSGEMPLAEVEKLCATGDKRASNRFKGYPICVNNTYFFACEVPPAKKSNRPDPKAD